jgi:hypothetical protein
MKNTGTEGGGGGADSMFQTVHSSPFKFIWRSYDFFKIGLRAKMRNYAR